MPAGALGDGIIEPALDPFAFHVDPRRLIQEYDDSVFLGPLADLLIQVFAFLRIELGDALLQKRRKMFTGPLVVGGAKDARAP